MSARTQGATLEESLQNLHAYVGHVRDKKLSATARADYFDRVGDLIRQFDGNIDEAMDWLGSRHNVQSYKETLPYKFKSHEYKPSDGEAYGAFALLGPKIGSYVLNRWQNHEVITKDMWFARTMARYTNQSLLTKNGRMIGDLWGIESADDLRMRKITTKAWEDAGKVSGLTPMQVQQLMWEFEHRLYSKLGVGRDATYTSQGLEDGIRSIERGSTEIDRPFVEGQTDRNEAYSRRVGEEVDGRHRRSSGATPEAANGILQSIGRGSYNPVTKIIGLIKGKANLSTIAHEMAGHWLHDVLKDHEKYGPILEKHYGKFDVEGNRQNLERFARDVETYWMTSVPPRPELGNVFKAIRASFARIYRRTPTHGMDPEVRTLFEEIDDVMDDEVAGLVHNFEKLQSLERDQAALKRGAVHVGGAAARSEQRRRDRGMLVPLDGGEKRLRLSPDEMRLFLMAR